MFQLLGYFVHLVPGKAQVLHQKHLPQPMLAHSKQRQPAPLGREAHPPVLLVVEQVEAAALAGGPPLDLRRDTSQPMDADAEDRWVIRHGHPIDTWGHEVAFDIFRFDAVPSAAHGAWWCRWTIPFDATGAFLGALPPATRLRHARSGPDHFSDLTEVCDGDFFSLVLGRAALEPDWPSTPAAVRVFEAAGVRGKLHPGLVPALRAVALPLLDDASLAELRDGCANPPLRSALFATPDEHRAFMARWAQDGFPYARSYVDTPRALAVQACLYALPTVSERVAIAQRFGIHPRAGTELADWLVLLGAQTWRGARVTGCVSLFAVQYFTPSLMPSQL